MAAINSKFIKQLWLEPEVAIEKLDLVYVDHSKLTINRRRKNNTFFYESNGKPISKKEVLKRIDELVIPPAWKDVKIASINNAHLQATGRDEKSRKQYRYHPSWSKIRNQTKFYRLLFFSEQLPKIRRQVEIDLKQKQWTQSKTAALVIRLLEETHIRIGNSQYAKRNKTYGLSTLRSKHLNLYKNKLKFSFVGKRGKHHEVTLRNKKLMRLVNSCHELPGWELFQYYDENGKKHSIESGDINAYLFEICQQHFTAKDFRTWSASKIFLESLYDLHHTNSENNKEANILAAYDATAKALGNTRNVCRKYYVHPVIPESYKNEDISKAFEMMSSSTSEQHTLSVTELALVALLKHYKPEFKI